MADAENPTFTSCPNDVATRVLSRNSCNDTLYWSVPFATDNDDLPILSSTHLPGISQFDCGVTEVTYMATDASGNVGYCTFDVTVNGMILSHVAPVDNGASGKPSSLYLVSSSLAGRGTRRTEDLK